MRNILSGAPKVFGVASAASERRSDSGKTAMEGANQVFNNARQCRNSPAGGSQWSGTLGGVMNVATGGLSGWASTGLNSLGGHFSGNKSSGLIDVPE